MVAGTGTEGQDMRRVLIHSGDQISDVESVGKVARTGERAGISSEDVTGGGARFLQCWRCEY